MNPLMLRARQRELKEELRQKTADYQNGVITKQTHDSWIYAASAEAERIDKELAVYDRAKAFSGTEVGPHVAERQQLTDGAPIRPASPMDLTSAQLKSLWQAAESRTPFSVTIQPKAAGFRGDISTKTPALESGIGGSFTGTIPPVQTQFATGLGYETTRIADLLPAAAMLGPSATWLSHDSNGAEVSGVVENGVKGDISPVITEHQVKPQKIAGLVSYSLEAWQDTANYGQGSFSSWLPTELTRSLINAESLYLLQATTGASNSIAGGPVNSTFNGLLNQSGTITRAVGSDAPLDALSKAYVDLRVGSAYANPDLVLMSPKTLGALRRIKDADGRYVLSLLAGPLALTADGSPATVAAGGEPNEYALIPQGTPALSGNLWGAPIATTTQIPDGTAIVMSTKAGGAIYWQRLGMVVEFNQWSDTMWSNNLYSWRAEARIALSVNRPSAVNIVTGLPTT
jgi:HK97 family phage major capsid protein